MPANQSDVLSLKSAYAFGKAHGLAAEVTAIEKMDASGPKKTSSVRRGYIAHLFQQHNLLDTFIKECWPVGANRPGQTKLAWYEKLRREHGGLMDDEAQVDADDTDPAAADDEEEAGFISFIMEKNLRDFLEHHLEVLEPQLKLYQANGKNGIEFQIDQGRIDILAVDAKGKFVVIELKLSRGREKALGQLLYYMGWVDTHLGNGPCRGMIVAADISTALATAVKRVPGVSLFNYRLALSVERVE